MTWRSWLTAAVTVAWVVALIVFRMPIKTELTALDGRLWPLLLAFTVGGVIWAWRVAHQKSFDALPSRVKALPAAALGAALSASAAVTVEQMIAEAAIGVFSGLTAVGGHEVGTRLLSGKGTKPETA